MPTIKKSKKSSKRKTGKKNNSELKKSLVLLVLVSLFCFLIIEMAVRLAGDFDEDGQFVFGGDIKEGGKLIRPHKLPFHSISNQIAEFEKNIEDAYLVPSQTFGWTVNVNATGRGGYYRSNSIGIRSDREFDIKKPFAVLRIALFGDSFVHGDDRPLEKTWAHYLEKEFVNDHKDIEIMNFGVGGTGNGQAYLKWRYHAKPYNPDIVLIGFQPENCKRSLNIFREFYFRGRGIPFSKPRFILKNGELELVNFPTIHYKDIPEEIKNFHSSPLKEHEYHFKEKDYSNNPLYWSKTIALFFGFLDVLKKQDKTSFYKDGAEESELCYQIIKKFHDEVSMESEVFIVHLPGQQHLLDRLTDGSFVYQPLLERVRTSFNVIDTGNILVETAEVDGVDSLFKGHYSAKGNKIVALEIHKYLKEKSLTN